MAKKKLNKQERHDQRIRKARQWLTTYTGSPKKMTKRYRERFHLDINTAIRDLQEIGVEYTQEYLDAVKKSEEERIRQKHMKQFEDFYEEEVCLGITDRLYMRIMEENDFDDYLKVLKDTMPKAMQKGEMKKSMLF